MNRFLRGSEGISFLAIAQIRDCLYSQSRATIMSGSTTGTLKRFYKLATVSDVDGLPGHFHVCLDGKKVKCPNQDLLIIPSRVLAQAIAAEFQYQSAEYIRPITQPLYRLQWQAQLRSFTRQGILDRMLQYVDSDPVCMRSAECGHSFKLQRLQDRVFGEIIEWANMQFDISLKTSDSLYGCQQDADIALSYAQFLQKLPYPQLLALSELAGACKSLLIAFAVHGKKLSVQQALEASRLEEDVQMEQFGLVEGGHDLDIVDLRTRIAGCALYMQMLEMDMVLSDDEQRVHHDVNKALDTLAGLGF